jgi:hypothetical protein
MISSVVGVISATMAEIDTPDERNISIKKRRMADKYQLLVVRSAAAHSLIKQNFTTRLSHLDGDASILFRTKRETVAVRTPEQPANVDTSLT